jgi:lipooligosaccharide transport system permease protein
LHRRRRVVGPAHLLAAVVDVTAPAVPTDDLRVFFRPTPARRVSAVVERNVISYRRRWGVFLSAFVEPFLFLFSIGIGVGKLVGEVPGPGGVLVPYDAFVAPGLMAVAAMYGAIFDTTFNFFFKFKYAKTFDAMLATPLGVGDVAAGEAAWALMRGGLNATTFLLAMVALDLVGSWWAVLAIPGAILIGFAFAGAGLGLTTFMRSFVDFDYVNLAIVPLFLFSATFYPLSRYPDGLAWVVRATPLYQGVVLERSLVFGDLHWSLLLHVAYLLVMGFVGVRVAGRRLRRLLQP